jgi:hypothetical protein
MPSFATERILRFLWVLGFNLTSGALGCDPLSGSIFAPAFEDAEMVN